MKQAALNFGHEIVVDLFAGGGGLSTAAFGALGRDPDVAINHSDDAISMHMENHPSTTHFVSDVYEVDPVAATANRPVGLLHASPDCTHFSQARGGQSRDTQIRSLSWVVLKWAGKTHPRVITLENVKQILQWSPLVAKRDKKTGRVVKADGTIAEPGEHVARRDQFLVPDKRRLGHNWRFFVRELQRMGYQVEWRKLVACDYGAPTSRERLFLVARRDGRPIVWPKPTHAAPTALPVKRGRLKPYRTAAECIDWSIPCPSIFERKKPLADATMRRVAKGIQRYVLDANKPFIVPVTHGGGDRVHPTSEPLRTVTTAHRGEFTVCTPILAGVGGRAGQSEPRSGAEPFYTITGKADTALVGATLVQTGYGERTGQSPRVPGIKKPLGTIVAGGAKHAVVAAHLAKFRGSSEGTSADTPVPTITSGAGAKRPAGAAHALGLVTAHLETFRRHAGGASADDPLATIAAGGQHHGLIECTLSPEAEAGALRVAAFLMCYYGNGGEHDLRKPAATVTTKDRLALVTVTVRGTPYVIVDIGLRMLQPRELFLAQGFPPNYQIDYGHDGRKFTKSTKVKLVGNSVSPPPAEALIAANFTHEHDFMEAVA